MTTNTINTAWVTNTILSILLSLFLILSSSCNAQKKDSPYIRPPSVAGSFYPSDPVQLKAQLKNYFDKADNNRKSDIILNQANVAAVIVPHAGYIYSGEVAASAFSYLDPDKKYSRIFIIGTSHQVFLKGASIFKTGNFSTPLGIVEVDTSLANQLIHNNSIFEDSPAAHSREHSIEVQLPFLQYKLKNKFKIVPIIIGTQSETTCKKIAGSLKPYLNDENLFVISSDFSHYPEYSDANKADKTTGDAIASNSPDTFLKAIGKNDLEDIPGLATSCCGWSSVLTLLNITKDAPGVKAHHIKYQNSGDVEFGDKSRVVGYHSFIFTRESGKSEPEGFTLSKDDKIELLKIARTTIEYWLKNTSYPFFDESKLSEALKTSCGAFVTLTVNNQLRGCIGRFVTTEPLFKVVREMAMAAATQDSRFEPVELYEMKNINVEISVLTPLKKINSADEFEIGKHGIYMIKGSRGGTFLPQVAEETGWTKEEFLGHCARDKAGIGWDGWKDADLYTYEALVFSEKELLPPGK